jgi:3-deoxy-D-manno-octulosonic-acid transferase
VLCGPNIIVSNEAGLAKEKNIVVVVTGRTALETQIRNWFHGDALSMLREQVQTFVNEHAGATKRIAARLNEALHG